MSKSHGIFVPYPLAMVVCDGAWRDPYTGKFTLIGTFSAITGSEFPMQHPIISVYVALTDGRGRVPVKVELVDVDEEREPVFTVVNNEVIFPDPRVIAEMVIAVKGVTFPEAGEYRLKLFAYDEFLLERRVLVADTSSGGESPSKSDVEGGK